MDGVNGFGKILTVLLTFVWGVPAISAPVATLSPSETAVEDEAEDGEARADWFYGERSFPGVFLPDGAFAAAYRETAIAAKTTTPTLRWRAIGPEGFAPIYPPVYQGRGPISGRVTSIATHPTDPATAYIGAATGGVWKTTNDGRSWKPLMHHEAAVAIGAVALDRKRPSTVYAGTGEASQWYLPYLGVGLFRSTNGGRSWTKLDVPLEGCYFADLVVAGDRAATVFAAVVPGQPSTNTHGTPPACRQPGVWRSSDRGRTWKLVLPRATWEVELHGGTVVAGVDGAVQSGGIFRSTDLGETWQRLQVGLPPTGFERVEVAIAPSKPSRMYAVFERAGTSDLLGVWTTADGGDTWTPLTYDSQPCAYSRVMVDFGQCFYDFVVEVDVHNEDLFYLGGIELFRYERSGSGISIDNDIATGIHVDQHALAFDAADRLWIGNDGGVYRDDPNTRGFTNLNRGLAITQFYPGIAGSSRGPLLGGSQDNGTALYAGSKGWTGVLGADGGYSAIHHEDELTMYGTYQNLEILQSIDGGRKWRYVLPQPYASEPSAFIAPLVMHPRQSNTLYAGTRRVLRTTSAARRWEPVSPPLDGGTIRSIAAAASSSDIILAGTSNGGLFMTSDEGATWRRLGAGVLPLRVPTDIAVDDPGDTIYVTFSGFGSGHVFVSTDSGATWKDISRNLPNAPATAVAVDDRSGRIYVGTDVGVFSSNGPGQQWVLENRGMPTAIVTDLLIDHDTGEIVASTYGRSMFVAPLR